MFRIIPAFVPGGRRLAPWHNSQSEKVGWVNKQVN